MEDDQVLLLRLESQLTDPPAPATSGVTSGPPQVDHPQIPLFAASRLHRQNLAIIN